MLLTHPIVFIWLLNLLLISASAALVIPLFLHQKSRPLYYYFSLLINQLLIQISVLIFSYLKQETFFFDSMRFPELPLFGGLFQALMIYFFPMLFFSFNEIFVSKRLKHILLLFSLVIFLKAFLVFLLPLFFFWNKFINGLSLLLITLLIIQCLVSRWKNIREKKRFFNLLGISFLFALFVIHFLINYLLRNHPEWLPVLSWGIQTVFLLFGSLNFIFLLKHIFQKLKEHPTGNQGVFQGTDREKEVALFILQGLTNREISEKLFVSENTVKKHIQNIYSKNHVNNRMQLALLFSPRSENS